MKVRLFVFIGLIASGFGARAQALKYSNEFLTLGAGAKAAGLGGAVVAGVNDATAAYWNPAGLLSVKDHLQFTFMHNEQFAGIVKHDYGTIAHRLNDKSVVALSVTRVGVDDIPNTLDLFQNGQIDYSRIQSFSAVDYAFTGSYARELGIEGLKLGGNVKVIRRIVGEFANAWGFGFDIGAQYQFKKWNMGLVVRDITSTFNVWDYNFSQSQKQVLLQTNNKLPENSLEITLPTSIAGISRRFTFFKEKLSVVPELNADITFDGQRNVLVSNKYVNINPRGGLELGYRNIVFLRSGVMNIQKETDFDGTKKYTYTPTIGVGLQINNLAIDYALSNAGSVSSLPYSNIISLRLSIQKKS